MSKSKNKKSLKAEIKAMETKKSEESAPVLQTDKKVAFESWYHQRKSKIAKCHRKEILWADFQARKMNKEATMAEYDKALELYGVRL